MEILDGIARRRVDAIVANSEGVMQDAVLREGIAPDRIRVIRNGAELPTPLTDEARNSIRRKWGAGPEDIVIGCVANYRQTKGLDTVVAVASVAAVAVPRALFVLIGEGPYRAELEHAIEAAGLGDHACDCKGRCRTPGR